MIESDPAFEICAVAGTAEDAIEALDQVRVDIVILDLEMPGAGGLKSIPRIIAAAAGAKVMPLEPDHILVAPGDAHLTLEPGKNGAIVRLSHGRATSGCLPSLDPMRRRSSG